LLRGVPPQDVPRKVVVGRNGRLFLDYDTNQIMAQHTGLLRFTPRELERWRALLEERIAWLVNRGAHYLFLVVPDAAAVFPDDLPDDVRPLADRPLVQLMDHLRDTESRAALLYPLPELARERRHVTYPKTETHWSGWGAFVAYRALIERLAARVPVRAIGPDQVVVHEDVREGDLGSKLDPPAQSEHAFVSVRDPRARFVSDNRIMNRGRRLEWACDDAPNVCCLVLCDSYAASFAHVLAESFRRVVLAYVPTLDRTLVEEVRPQVVVQEMAERFLIAVPDDMRDPGLSQWESTKRAQGKVYGPRTGPGISVQSAVP
jgi:SGNH hydrolase-like domain, acetyltransferase AlgX